MESFVRSLALSTGGAISANGSSTRGVGNTTWVPTTPARSGEPLASGTSVSSWNTSPIPTIASVSSVFSPVANFSALAISASITSTNPYFNGTDLNNATQCWPAYWSYSSMTQSWSRAHASIVTRTVTYTSTFESGIPEPSPNSTYSVLCDGLPRFDSEDDATNAMVLLPTPSTTVGSYLAVDYTWPTGDNFPPSPSCSIRNADECSAAWSLFGSSLASSNDAWSTSNILTVSLASPPTSVIVNDRTTPLTAPPGAYPTLTLHGEEYGADEGTYTIFGGTNLYGEVTLEPGGRQVLTWDMDQISRPFGPTAGNCSRPEGNIIQSQCSTAQCTLGANSVELLYFPPPSTSRDLCANTSPAFNSYSVPIFSHPHASTIINTTTYWYDKAYVRYAAVSAYKWCALDNQLGSTQVSVGGTYSSHLVEISSSDLSSICGWKFNPTRPYGLVIGATAKPFNFEDLVGDIPASAYQCMPRCQSACEEIVSSWYIPGLAVPPQVRAQDPQWASCVPQFDGVPDPPIALASVPNFLTSSSPSAPRPTKSAEPGQTITTGASPTAEPITQPAITTRFTSTISPPTSRPAPNDPGTPADPDPNDPDVPKPSVSRPADPPTNNPNPATAAPPNPQAPSNEPLPISDPPVGPTPIGTIGNSIINSDPSHPGTITISDPRAPSSAQTLTAGSDPLVISGTTLSVDPTSGAVVVTGESALPVVVGSANGKPVFADPTQPGVVVVGDPDLGQPAETLSVQGSTVVIDGETLVLSLSTAVQSPTAAVQASATVAGLSIVVLADGIVVVDNWHTMRPGDELVVDGHRVVVDAEGVVWVDGQRVQTSTASKHGPESTTAAQRSAVASSVGESSGGEASGSSSQTALGGPKNSSSGGEVSGGPSQTSLGGPENSSAAAAEGRVPRRWGWIGLVGVLWVGLDLGMA